MEHLEIKITECENGFIIEEHQWVDETCANVKKQWVAHEARKVGDLIYKMLPKG